MWPCRAQEYKPHTPGPQHRFGNHTKHLLIPSTLPECLNTSADTKARAQVKVYVCQSTFTTTQVMRPGEWDMGVRESGKPSRKSHSYSILVSSDTWICLACTVTTCSSISPSRKSSPSFFTRTLNMQEIFTDLTKLHFFHLWSIFS